MSKSITLNKIGAILIALVVAMAMMSFNLPQAEAVAHTETVSSDGYEFTIYYDDDDVPGSVLFTKYSGMLVEILQNRRKRLTG